MHAVPPANVLLALFWLKADELRPVRPFRAVSIQSKQLGFAASCTAGSGLHMWAGCSQYHDNQAP